jgi:hypothetical protein
MEYNPELEKAEAELQERFRGEKAAQDRGPGGKWKDNIIFIAAVVQFLHAMLWFVIFLIAPFVFLVNSKHAATLFIVWILSLPIALTGLGTSIALSRVLDLTSPLRLKPPESPDSEPGQ